MARIVNAIEKLGDAVLASIRFAPPRTFVEWAEDEVIIPEGDQKGSRFRWDRRPWQRLIADAMQDHAGEREWRRCFLSAGSQSGKTFFVVMFGIYHLAELADEVQIAAPAKTTRDSVGKGKFEPMVSKSPGLARRVLPGNYKLSNKEIDFRIECPNGGKVTFPFSGDSMVSYPARITVGTEAAKMPTLSKTSDMISQLQARADGYADGWAGIFESTPSGKSTRHAQEMEAGTCSTIVCPCPHCDEPFEPGSQESMKGWQDAETREQAGELVTMVCPHCGTIIDESHRRAMQMASYLHHEHPERDVLSVTVNWFHTPKSFARYGAAAWEAMHESSPKTTAMVRRYYQDFLAEPTDIRIEAAGNVALPDLHKENITALQDDRYRFNQILCPETAIVVGAMDIGKHDIWWMTAAYWLHNDDLPILNYGRFRMAERQFDADLGRYATPLPSRDRLVESLDNCYARMLSAVSPSLVAVDVGYEPFADKTNASPENEVVATFAHETSGMIGVRGVKTPTRNFGKTPLIPPPACDLMQQTQVHGREQINVYINDVKTRLARAILRTTPGNQVHLPGNAVTANSIPITTHLTAEYPVESGDKLLWVNEGANHLWDCLVYCYAMGIMLSSIWANDHPAEYAKLKNRSTSALAKAREAKAAQQAQPAPSRPATPPRPRSRPTAPQRRKRLPNSATGGRRR